MNRAWMISLKFKLKQRRKFMLSDEQLENVLGELQAWFFWKSLDSDTNAWRVLDLLELPQPYLDKVKKFISNHSKDELKKLSPKYFISKSTGKSTKIILDLISKIREVNERRADIEEDFV